MQSDLIALLDGIDPCDPKEETTRARARELAVSGADLYRGERADRPDPHLVSYFAVIDRDHMLLGDHRKSGLLLPSGGHVEPGEHPRRTVEREAQEELSLKADFLFPEPIFVTATQTVGPNSHTDISLWFVLRGDRSKPIAFDRGEYSQVRWFALDHLPTERTDPELPRFARKLSKLMEAA
ncbi:MAG: NUDIX hydrolase [Pseudomonadota bacterium]